jgi:hypothetical protein
MATGTPATTARQSAEQQVHYLRFTVNFNDTGIATGNGKQWLPKGAVIIGTDVNIVTAFNAATTNVLSAGIEASTYANIVTSAQTVSGTPGLKANLPPTGTALVPLAADSQVFALYTQTGTAATTGQAIIIVKYIPANDL